MAGAIKIFDCFVFGQRERAILNLRIDTTCGIVDHIVIAIGTTSLSGDKLQTLHLPPEKIAAPRKPPWSRQDEEEASQVRAGMRYNFRRENDRRVCLRWRGLSFLYGCNQ